jgi:alkylmercury lyase
LRGAKRKENVTADRVGKDRVRTEERDMASKEIEELGRQIGEAAGRNRGSATIRHLSATVIRLLANGEPVAVDAIVAASGLPYAEVLALLRGFPPLEWGQGDTVVGLGLTLNPTPHRFEMHGRQLYT